MRLEGMMRLLAAPPNPGPIRLADSARVEGGSADASGGVYPHATAKRQRLDDGEDEHEPQRRRQQVDGTGEDTSLGTWNSKAGEDTQKQPRAVGYDFQGRAADVRRKRTVSVSRRYRGAVIELPGDEELMQAVVRLGKKFADPSQPTQPLWEAIARTCGDRFKRSGNRAIRRVQWLSTVWKDKRHPMHSRMTTDLKDLLLRYAQAREKRVEVKWDDNGEDVEDDDRDDSSEDQQGEGRFPRYDTNDRHLEIDVAVELLVTQIVLKHAPRFQRAFRRLDVWGTIAKDSRGRYTTARSAQERTLWLCKVACDANHPRHSETTPPLREMLRKVLNFWSDDVDTRYNRPCVVTQLLARKLMVDADKDELLMRRVLKTRLYTRDEATRAVIWTEIIDTVKNPLLRDELSGVERVRFLTQVFQNPAHAQHTKLTDRLRELLDKYVRLVSYFRSTQRVAELSRPPSKKDSSRGPHFFEEVNSSVSVTPSPRWTDHQKDTESQTPRHTSVQAQPEVSPVEEPRSPPPVVHPAPEPQEPPAQASLLQAPSTQGGLTVASLVKHVEKLEEEQCELRCELRAQRELHHRETTAMLELLEKQRQDRKDEFTAMMALVSGYGGPRAPVASLSGNTGSTSVNAVEDCLI